MRSEFQVGRIFGIPIKIHWTLLIFIPILGWLIASNIENIAQLPFLNLDVTALESREGRLFAGFTVTVGLFISVLLHELGHAWVALRNDIGVRKITLWIFGGLAQLEGITQEPKAEAKIAIAGPIVSLALGGMPAAFLLVDPGTFVKFLVGYLAYLNVVLAVFNMLPAFPLDGGRLLRAFLAMRMPYAKATNLASDIGKGMAVLMGLAGLFGSVWLILIAFFIYMGATQEARGVEIFDALQQVQVREIMDPDVPVIQPDAYVDEMVPLMLSTHHTGFPVVVGQEVVGLVTLDDIRGVPEGQRSLVRVREVMDRDMSTIGPDEAASSAMRTMMQGDVDRMLVLDGDRLVGMLTRQGLMQAFQVLQVVPRVEVHPMSPEELEHVDRADDEQDPYRW